MADYIIRKAVPEDLIDIAKMGKEFYDYSGIADVGLGFDPTSFIEHMTKLATSSGMCLFVAESGGKAMGMIGGILHPFWLNKHQSVVTENFWWVDPEHRGSMTAFRLVDRLVEWAKEQGSANVYLSCINNGRRETLNRIFTKRLKFVELETSYCRSLNNA